MVTSRRRGMSRLGCLVALALLTVGAYFAINLGEPYYRYYRFQDAMEQEARFAAHKTDDDIRRRLRVVADSLGLPEGAGMVQIRRSGDRVMIWSEYYEYVELPMFVRELHFSPTAERSP